ncbi:hypothetical protein ACFOSH_36190 [Amycolatopsis speibonae]|uniref:AAA family ATPase n=1 Tax=Amycolatopsis speibonae TaxID=1450224 RepID=A0ABV7P8P6_9PSEU
MLPSEALEDLAARYRMSGGDLRAVAAVADADARLSGNGHPVTEHVEPAIAIVTRGRTSGAVRSILPRRTTDDLVLPDAQMSQLTEIASAFRAWPRVAESWAFARKMTAGGVKALFTGDPGTGKTMSAEVVTVILGLELLKVDHFLHHPAGALDPFGRGQCRGQPFSQALLLPLGTVVDRLGQFVELVGEPGGRLLAQRLKVFRWFLDLGLEFVAALGDALLRPRQLTADRVRDGRDDLPHLLDVVVAGFDEDLIRLVGQTEQLSWPHLTSPQAAGARR